MKDFWPFHFVVGFFPRTYQVAVGATLGEVGFMTLFFVFVGLILGVAFIWLVLWYWTSMFSAPDSSVDKFYKEPVSKATRPTGEFHHWKEDFLRGEDGQYITCPKCGCDLAGNTAWTCPQCKHLLPTKRDGKSGES